MVRTLSGATTPDKSGPRNDSNEGIVRIPQSSSITGALLSDCLVSLAGHSLVGGILQQRCSLCILQPQPIGLM